MPGPVLYKIRLPLIIKQNCFTVRSWQTCFIYLFIYLELSSLCKLIDFSEDSLFHCMVGKIVSAKLLLIGPCFPCLIRVSKMEIERKFK